MHAAFGLNKSQACEQTSSPLYFLLGPGNDSNAFAIVRTNERPEALFLLALRGLYTASHVICGRVMLDQGGKRVARTPGGSPQRTMLKVD